MGYAGKFIGDDAMTLSTDYCPYCDKEIGGLPPFERNKCYYNCEGQMKQWRAHRAKLWLQQNAPDYVADYINSLVHPSRLEIAHVAVNKMWDEADFEFRSYLANRYPSVLVEGGLDLKKLDLLET